MISSYIIVSTICIIFWMITLFQRDCFLHKFSKLEYAALYLVSRIIPIASLSQRNPALWFCLILDLFIIFVLCFYIYHEKNKSLHGFIFSLYIFSPLPILSILSENAIGLCLTMFFLALLCGFDIFESTKNRSLICFLPEYLLSQIGILGLFISAELLHQNFSIKNKVFPILYIISLLIILSSIVGGIYQILTKSKSYVPVTSTAKVLYQKSANSSLTVKDILLINLFTLLFAALVLFRLGNFKVPETLYNITAEQTRENQIMLNFDQGTTLSDIYIYLGYNAKRVVSFSSLNGEEDSEWDTFLNGYSLDSAFRWNPVAINRNLTSLGMNFTDGCATLHEIVCLDPTGKRILPSNAQDYPALFDEQALFPSVQTSYDQSMFDEVYHARTAYEFLYHLPICEDTHPPLGKSIISIGIWLFGMNPFGWRIACAVFGILMVPFTYLFAHKMFGKTRYACCATILLCTQFMNFTLSRIATLDILVAFSILLMFFFMYGYSHALTHAKSFRVQMIWLLSAGISMGVSIAIKWTGFYASAGIAILFFISFTRHINGWKNAAQHKKYIIKTGLWCTICFIVIPLAIYILSYIPFTKSYPDKGVFQSAIENSIFMLNFHSSAHFYHPYSSEWYEWLIDKRPLLDSYSLFPDGKVSSVATFINPLICWGGLISLAHQIYLWICRKCKTAEFLTLAWCSVVVPWFFVHRTVFIYQYFLGSILLIFMIVNSISHLKGETRYLTTISLASIILFIMFYPVLSGIVVSSNYISVFLEWLPTWTFVL